MTTAIVFDIREFAVHDGPGIRTSIFLKGCLLSCSWCHNPEGRAQQPQIIRAPGGERVVGKEYSPLELATILNKQARILQANEGGVTFSGGEPLLQAEFVAQVVELLDGVHVLLDTSGYASEPAFVRVVERCDLVFYDLKLMDREAHRRYTGVYNDSILRNLRVMSSMDVPFVIRVPHVPGVTDTDANLAAIAETVCGLPNLIRVDLLPYNRAAGGKYQYAGMQWNPEFDETRELNINPLPFQKMGVPVRVV
ncbi:MAG: radical SAM protein [Chloroflexi bacterium]|nr:radical SAM protein [Chloroflexota bacterium]